ncbi:MAG: arginase family protein [Actinobacteria bacterium]|nr:arginase family protein [Actinomycetota bacterium]
MPGARGFLRSPGVEPDAVALRAAQATQAVFGMPFDSTTSYHTGSMHGPHAIRDASEQFLPCHYDFDLDLGDAIGLVGCGDAAVVAGGRAARRPARPTLEQ